MKNYNYKKRNLLTGPQLLVPIFIIVGLLALLSPFVFAKEQSIERVIVVGVGAIILGLLINASYGGTLIDFTGRKYKAYFSLVGYKIGEWTPLPEIVTVRVMSTTYVRHNISNGISPTLSGTVTDFRVLLYSSGSQPVLMFVYSKKGKAVNDARILATNLEANLVLNLPEGE